MSKIDCGKVAELCKAQFETVSTFGANKKFKGYLSAAVDTLAALGYIDVDAGTKLKNRFGLPRFRKVYVVSIFCYDEIDDEEIYDYYDEAVKAYSKYKCLPEVESVYLDDREIECI